MSFGYLVPRRRKILNAVNQFPFVSLQRQINGVFDDLLTNLDYEPLNELAEKISGFSPRINLTENDKEIRLTAELAGIDQKDVEISLNSDSLTIRGEKKEVIKQDETNGHKHYSECRYGAFERVIPLNCEVNSDKVEATSKNGVLTIVLPKKELECKQSKKISVREG